METAADLRRATGAAASRAARQTITVVVVSPQPLVRRGLRHLFGIEAGFRVLATCATAAECRPLVARLRPHAVVVDLPGGRAAPAAAEELRDLRDRLGARLVLLAGAADRADLARLVRPGTVTVLDRDGEPMRLQQTVRIVASGTATSRPGERGSALPPLTRRELEVLELIGDGASNERVAAQLGITYSTAKFHVRGLLAKLGARNRTEIAVMALRHGVV